MAMTDHTRSTVDHLPADATSARSAIVDAIEHLCQAGAALDLAYGQGSPEAESVWQLFDRANDLLGPRSF